MITPSNVTKAQFIEALRNNALTHVRFSFSNSRTLTDSDFHSDGIIFRTYFNADTNVTIGKSVKKEIAFKLMNTTNAINFQYEDEFLVEVGVEIGNVTEWAKIGYYTIVEPDKYIEDEIFEFVAYDRMSKFDVPADEWLKSLTYPMTVQQIFESLCTYVGLTGEIGAALSNMKSRSFSEAPIQNLGVMCRDVLELIAEACGCYAVITNEGNCKLVSFSPASYPDNGSTVIYTVSNDEVFSRKTKPFSESINGLNVKQTEDDVGVLYPSTATEKIYVIVDNPFLVTANATEESNYIQPLYSRLSGMAHWISEMTCVGNPLIEAGDIINLPFSNSNNNLMPIFIKEMLWNGAFTDAYITTGTKHRQSYTSAIKQKLSQGGRYHIFKNTVDQLYSELYDPTTGDVSILNQTAQALGLSANGIDIVGGKYVKIISGGTFLVEATDFKIDSANKLMKCGSWQFDNTGMKYTFANNNEFRIYNGADPYSSGGSYPANMKSGIRVHKPTGWNEFGILVPDYAGVLREFSFFPQGASAGMPGGVSFIAPGDIDNDIYAHTYGWYSVTSEYIYALQAINPSSRERKHDIRPLDDKSELIDKLQPVSFVYNKDKKGKTCFGLIYEDTVDIIPEICFDEKEKGINYTELVPVLLKEIQSLRKRVASLENPTN